ncbi:MAG: glycine cleavage system protein GcvH [Chlamydiia bacterium]|nr:glycine cleavage system protein GcvH [Chlamydiia bacterium]
MQIKYTDSHEWIECDGKKGRVGITTHAQKELGEIVYVELPKVGDQVKAGEEIAILESTKAAADIYCPVSGTITCVNTALLEDISLLNASPSSAGYLFEITLTHPEEVEMLLSEEGYGSLVNQ